MKTFKLPVNTSWSDTYLTAEHFASYCGFRYPKTQPAETGESGRLALRASMQTDPNNATVQTGLLVWHNANYIPEVQLDKAGNTLHLSIANQKQLPYPVIKRTEAWLDALGSYLGDVSRLDARSDTDARAKQRFMERLLAM